MNAHAGTEMATLERTELKTERNSDDKNNKVNTAGICIVRRGFLFTHITLSSVRETLATDPLSKTLIKLHGNKETKLACECRLNIVTILKLMNTNGL
jgi:hypothetical protein